MRVTLCAAAVGCARVAGRAWLRRMRASASWTVGSARHRVPESGSDGADHVASDTEFTDEQVKAFRAAHKALSAAKRLSHGVLHLERLGGARRATREVIRQGSSTRPANFPFPSGNASASIKETLSAALSVRVNGELVTSAGHGTVSALSQDAPPDVFDAAQPAQGARRDAPRPGEP